MEIFTIITDDGSLYNEIIQSLIGNGFIFSLNASSLTIYKNGYRDQYKEDQFVQFETYELKEEIVNQYDEAERQVLQKHFSALPLAVSLSYRRLRGFQLLDDLVDMINDMIINKGIGDRVIIEEGYGGTFLLFNDFLKEWQNCRGFFYIN